MLQAIERRMAAEKNRQVRKAAVNKNKKEVGHNFVMTTKGSNRHGQAYR
jgi:hypothetical protein